MEAKMEKNNVLFRCKLFFCIFFTAILFFTAESRAEQSTSLLYGIPCKGMEIKKSSIQSGQNLSEILLAARVPYSRIHKVAKESKNIFDVRRIQAGKPYTLMYRLPKDNPDGPAEKCFFIYEQNAVDYVVFELGEKVRVYQKSHPLETVPQTAEGVITSSLTNAFADAELPYELAEKLSEIYAWTLDFYHFRKGDSFRIVYEEKYVNDKLADVGKILGARITYQGKEYYAFYYPDGENSGQYLDEKGRSLRKSFLKSPLKFSRISSGFSLKRLHPILNQYRPHPGIDYAAPSGTPVLSVGDGVVEKVNYNSSAGRYIQVRHSDRYMSQYLHLSKYAEEIKTGCRVSQGQVIGYVGRTGLATGPHLDFRFWIDGKAVNYLVQDDIRLAPLEKKELRKYLAQTAPLKADLDIDKIKHYSAQNNTRRNLIR